MDLVLSKYQRDILDYFKSPNSGNMLINAYAGSGKSTTARMLTEVPGVTGIYLAFNASIVKEFKEKITNPKIRICTMHSLGLSIMNYNLKCLSEDSDGAVLDNLKIYRIIDEALKFNFGERIPFELKLFYSENFNSLYNLLRATLTDVDNMSGIKALVNNHNLFNDISDNQFAAPSDYKIMDVLKFIDSRSIQIFNERSVIDFGDMLYITYLRVKDKTWKIPYFAKYSNIFADEVQDFTNLQLAFLPYIRRYNGKYVFLGDNHQSIYAFAGSNAYAFKSIPKLFAPIKEFDLPITYRCPVSHIHRVNMEFGIPLKPRPNAPEGSIKTIDKDEITNYVQPGDMILSRKNKWLAPVITDLIEDGFIVHLEDADLVKAVTKLASNKKFRTVADAKRHYTSILNKYNSRNQHENEEEIPEAENIVESDTNGKVDNIEFLMSIIKSFNKEHSSTVSITELQKFITDTLRVDPSPNAIKVSSVHKAKGLEADNVFVLNEGKICHSALNSKEQNAQERNLSYISLTRAKNNMYLVREEDN